MWLLRVLLLGILVLLFSATAHARLLLITSQDSPIYQEFQRGVLATLAKGGVDEMDIRSADDIALLDLTPYSAIIIAGIDAAKALAGRDLLNKSLIYTMLPLSSYEWLHDNGMLMPQHKLLYIDQPPSRYVQLVRAAMPEAAAIGYLYGETSVAYSDEIKKIVDVAKLHLIQADLVTSDKLSNLLKNVFADSDAVLLLPDPFFYNRRVVQEVLLASFRHKRPLVVYSESFLKAGAMLALFSTPEQIGRQTAEMFNCLGRPCYSAIAQRSAPKYFSVMVNEVVARQMGIKSRSAEELQRYLESVETAWPR